MQQRRLLRLLPQTSKTLPSFQLSERAIGDLAGAVGGALQVDKRQNPQLTLDYQTYPKQSSNRTPKLRDRESCIDERNLLSVFHQTDSPFARVPLVQRTCSGNKLLTGVLRQLRYSTGHNSTLVILLCPLGPVALGCVLSPIPYSLLLRRLPTSLLPYHPTASQVCLDISRRTYNSTPSRVSAVDPIIYLSTSILLPILPALLL